MGYSSMCSSNYVPLAFGKDDHECMTAKDLPANWPDHLDDAIKHLNDYILPSLKYSPNALLLGLVVNSHKTKSPDGIKTPTEEEVNTHLAFVEQQHLDGYMTMVDHTAKHKLYLMLNYDKKPPIMLYSNLVT
jgi:hypothetical protein